MPVTIGRRKLMAAMSCAAVTCPLAARAQQPAMPVIGYLGGNFPEDSSNAAGLPIFRKGLSENGFVEGRNVAVEYHWSEGDYHRLPGLAADLVRRPVAAIVAVGALPLALAAKAATTTIPIVFGIGGDPIKLGLVKSLNRPSGNLTGVTNLSTEVLSKRLELLHELVPTATKIALFVNPTNPAAETQSRDALAAARTLGLQFHVLHASTEREIDVGFATLAQLQTGGLVIAGDGLFVSRSEQLATLALRHAMPAIFQFREFAAAGGLMSYGASVTDLYRVAGLYTGRILKGEKPADLPVQQSAKVELVINLKTAKALSLEIPPTLLALADEVIE
jgi:putative tryptophan/tyrosine transport system substrate-binding protein